MSLEHALLDRLEKRNAQIAQLQSTVHALERAADSQREHAMMERGRLLEENKKLASALEVASSEAKQERAKYVDEQRRANGFDRQLAAACDDSNRKDREIGALKNEAGELLTHSFKLGRNNGENVKQFLDRICAEVPLESTREGLKNAVAKLQEVTTDRDRVLNELAAILAEANKSGRCGGDPVALLKQGQTDLDALTHFEQDNARLDALVSKLQGELDKQKTRADSMERQVGGLTRTRLRIEFERDRMKAKLDPLEVLYKTLKGYQDSDSILGHGTIIEVAIDKATEALSQLTA